MEQQQIIDTLNAFDLNELRGGLEDWPDADPNDVEGTLAFITELRDEVTNLVTSVDDPDDIGYTMAIRYIELKTRWIALNTKINYEMFKNGACIATDAMRGASVSALLGHIESIIDQKDIDTITDFLAEPTKHAA